MLRAATDRMIRAMARRLHAGVLLLSLSLAGSGPAWAQAAGDVGRSPGTGAAGDTTGSQDDSGWFDQKPAAPAPPASAQAAPAAPQPPPPADDADPRAMTDFRPHLDPYGTWVEDATYGTVWVPYEQTVGTGFAPYVSGGHWELASTGEWVWASDYPFGWIVFHYGRWVWTSPHGWVWIPGYRYAPAWVTWRVPTGADAYVGWAPVGPDFIWVHGYAVGYYYAPPYYWVFCPSYYTFHPHVHYYIVRDRPLMYRLAYSTRHYTAPQPTRTPASPTPAAARVPPHALPRDRVALRPIAPRTVAVPAPGIQTRSAFPTRERQAVRAVPTGPNRAAVATPAQPVNAVPAAPKPVTHSSAAQPAPARPAPARSSPALAPRPQQRTSAAPPPTRIRPATAPARIHTVRPGGQRR